MARTPTPLDQSVPEKGSDQSEGPQRAIEVKLNLLPGPFPNRRKNLPTQPDPYKTDKGTVEKYSLMFRLPEIADVVSSQGEDFAWEATSVQIREILTLQGVTDAAAVAEILDVAKECWQYERMLGALMSPSEILAEAQKRLFAASVFSKDRNEEYGFQRGNKTLDKTSANRVELRRIVQEDTGGGALDFEACLSKLDEFAKENPGKPVSPLARALFGKADGIAPATPSSITDDIGPLKIIWTERLGDTSPSTADVAASQPAPTDAPTEPLPDQAPRLWKDRDKATETDPIAFTRALYGPWLGKLTRGRLAMLDSALNQAVRRWETANGPSGLDLQTRQERNDALIKRVAAGDVSDLSPSDFSKLGAALWRRSGPAR